jgi:hypothetical protein
MAQYLLISVKKAKGCNLLISYWQVMRLSWEPFPHYSFGKKYENNLCYSLCNDNGAHMSGGGFL